jgi:short-subunit dehydrogenase
MTNITHKTIWVVGASSGMGRALALRLAEAGNFVIVSARSKDKLDDMVRQYPKKMVALPVDMNCADDSTLLQEQLAQITDAIDILVMAQGTVEYDNDLALDTALYRRVFETNFFSFVNTLAVAKPLLEASEQRGYIVGLSSMSMMIGFSRAEAYGASKAAVDYFLHSLLVDLPQRKFDVSIVRPGFVATPMTSVNDFPMPFLMTAEQAAERIMKGMEKRSRLIIFPRRLYCILTVLSWFSCVWYRYIGPQTSRYKV